MCLQHVSGVDGIPVCEGKLPVCTYKNPLLRPWDPLEGRPGWFTLVRWLVTQVGMGDSVNRSCRGSWVSWGPGLNAAWRRSAVRVDKSSSFVLSFIALLYHFTCNIQHRKTGFCCYVSRCPHFRDNAPGYLADDCQLVTESDNCVLPTLERSLSVGRAAVLDTGALPPQDHKSGTVCCSMSDYVGCHTASSGGYWYWRHLYSDSEATAQCELFLTAPIEIFLLTYILMTHQYVRPVTQNH